ncbi:MAG: kinase-like domain-containing protein [Monoraphidium minutum]|nr:MAG: kinase-like domain-containing protein [Monoraphidium minutum]
MSIEVLADFEFGQALGRGTFGVTRLVTERATAEPYACKTVCKDRIGSRQYVEDMRSEVAILQHLVGVPGVVQLRGAYEDCRAVNLVLELCAGGDLLDHILGSGRLPEASAAAAARAMLLALQRCHARGVAHRDVKPENFLLAAAGDAASVRIADFGVSALLPPGGKLREVVGTPYYMAPEVLLRCYDQSADIWSAGVVLYLMLSGELPFMGPSDRAVCAAVLGGAVRLDGPAWGGVPDAAKAVVGRMLERDPSRRAAAGELLAHPWLAQEGVVAAVAAAQAPLSPPAPAPAAAPAAPPAAKPRAAGAARVVAGPPAHAS